MKVFFFRRTGRGGGRYGKSKLKPLARWLQRRLIWLCGYTWEEMLAYHDEQEAKKRDGNANNVPTETVFEDESDDDDDDIFGQQFVEDNRI
jgi:hypothetical protein